ncbi:MAG: hypothetical protein MSH12_07440 [Romboutsia timonensis]|nr:hypothetical protein [Romboutsia timonensis]
MRKAISMGVISLICIFTSGCSILKDEDTIFGYMQGNTYINKVLGFSMNVPQDWVVNENFKNPGERTIEEILEKQDSLTIGGMVNMSMEEALSDSQEKEELSSIYISLLGKYTNIEEYAKEQFEKQSLNMFNKKINGKDYIVLEYANANNYVTMWNDKVMVFNTIYSDTTIEEINKSIESIKFK